VYVIYVIYADHTLHILLYNMRYYIYIHRRVLSRSETLQQEQNERETYTSRAYYYSKKLKRFYRMVVSIKISLLYGSNERKEKKRLYLFYLLLLLLLLLYYTIIYITV